MSTLRHKIFFTDLPTISSAANQTFAVGDPATAISQITITDAQGSAFITAGNNIRITIPAGYNMAWDATDTDVVIGGAAAAKIESSVNYENSDRTLVLDVNTNFAAGDQITVQELNFTSFLNFEVVAVLELEVGNDNIAIAVDDKTIDITEDFSISSLDNQIFQVGDGITAISPITVTQHIASGITTPNNIRIRIPAAFDMTWDNDDLDAIITGNASSKVSTTVPGYEDMFMTLEINVTTNFDADDQIIISGLSFKSFDSIETVRRLELEIFNDNVITATDDKQMRIDAA